MQTGNAKTLTPIRTYPDGTEANETWSHKIFDHSRIIRDNGRKSEWFTLTECLAHEFFDLLESLVPLDQHALDLISDHFNPDITEESILKAELSTRCCLSCQKRLRIKCGFKRIAVQGWPKKSPCCGREIITKPHGRYCKRCRKTMFETMVRKTLRYLHKEPPGFDGFFCSEKCGYNYGVEKAECAARLTDYSENLIVQAS